MLDTNSIKTGTWDGKINHKDFVTGVLCLMYEQAEETNRLLRKLAGEQESKNKPSLTEELKDICEDLVDNGKRDYSNNGKSGGK